MGNARVKMRLVLEEGKKGKWKLQQYYFFKISRISECKMGIAANILYKGMRPSRVFKSQHFLQ